MKDFAPLLFLGVATAAGCDAELYHDLPERRANEAVLALRESGLRADKKLEQRGSGGRASSFALTVPRSEESRALALLAERGLPRLSERTARASGALLPSLAEQRAEAAAALSADLAETIERLPEVAEARVHLALPEAEPLAALGSPRATASVLLRLRAPLSVKLGEVAELVSRAVPGLDPQDVAVVHAPFRAPPEPQRLAPFVTVGPLHVAPESRPLALFLAGLLVVLCTLCGVLVRLAWPKRSKPA
jgi:type III secretion protein J